MLLTREILDLMEDYWNLGQIEVGENYILIVITNSDDSWFGARGLNEYRDYLAKAGFTIYTSHSCGSFRIYIKKER